MPDSPRARTGRRTLLTAAAATTAAGAAALLTAGRAAAQPAPPRASFIVPACVPPGNGLPNPCPTVQPRRMARLGIDTVYSSTPTVVAIPDGRIRAAWFTGPDHYAYGTSRTMTALSTDHGATWSTPVEMPGMRNARDLSLSTDSTGRVWMTYFLATTSQPALGVYARSSTDGGATFGPVARVDPNLPYAACTAPIRDHDGALWMPYYGRYAGETIDSVFMARSTNGGATWTSARIGNGPAAGLALNEPWLVHPTRSGAPMRVFHRHGGWDRIGLTESLTGGNSWNAPRPLWPGTGRAAAIESGGKLIVVYRNITSRRADYAISLDGGLTWPHQGVPMLNNANQSQFGMVYAAPLELEPGRVYCMVAMEDSTTRCALWHGTFS